MKSLIMPRKMYWFALPALLFYLLFWITPLFRLLGYSFTDFNGYAQQYNLVGLTNYQTLLKEGTMANSIVNTLIYTVLVVAAGNLLSLAAALALNMKIRGKGLYRSLFYIPALFSTIVVGFIWSYVYMPKAGMIPALINNLGIKSNLDLLGNYKSALYAIAAVDIWKNLGTGIVIFLAGLQGVPTDLLEAGDIDGCSKWQLTRHIRLPLLAPAITINVTLGVINGLKAFDYPFIMTTGGPGKATYTIIYHIYRLAFNEQLFGKAAALGIVSFAIIILITSIMVLFMRKREVSV